MKKLTYLFSILLCIIYLTACLPDVPVCSKAINDTKILCDNNWNIDSIVIKTNRNYYKYKTGTISTSQIDGTTFNIDMRSGIVNLEVNSSLRCSDYKNYMVASINFHKNADTTITNSWNSYSYIENNNFHLYASVMGSTVDTSKEYIQELNIYLYK
jgi:hypothetical protein